MLSIIIPVYNVEEYLRQCVDSVLTQTLQDLEIILVNDGSTDRCGEICDAYAAKDNRVRVLHKPNGGLMSAWKHGLAAANGEWIGFVDSDDWIDSDMYETMLKAAEESRADMVIAALLKEFDDRTEKEQVFLAPGFYDRERIEKELFPVAISKGTMLDRSVSPSRVTKLFRKELLQANMAFCDERVSLGEDLVTTFACLCDAQSIQVLEFYPYHYRIRGTSIMGRYNPNFTKQAMLLNQTLENVAKQKNVYDFQQQLDNDLVSLVYYGFERNLVFSEKKASELIPYIRVSMAESAVQKAMQTEQLSSNNKKCALYKWLYKTLGVGALYVFIRYVVLPKRRYIG